MKPAKYNLLSRVLTLCAAFFLLICFSGCSEEENPVRPSDLENAHVRVNGEFALSGEKGVAVKNVIGSIIIAGGSADNSLSWFLEKTVTAETKQKANEELNAIRLSSRSLNDTLYLAVESPASTNNLNYSSNISLGIPYQMACIIEQASETFVSDLNSVLIIRNARGVELKRHSGPCQITLSQGKISMEIALPNKGYCKANTGQGDILLDLPATTSAVVFAKSGNGTVTHTGLNFTMINQHSPAFLEGKLGTGDGEIRLETNQGNIQLRGF